MTTDDALEFHTWPPSHGGQHAGVRTGVLAVHVRTGLAALSVEGASRAANQAIAVARLQAALAVLEAADEWDRDPCAGNRSLNDALEEARCQGLTGRGTTEGT